MRSTIRGALAVLVLAAFLRSAPASATVCGGGKTVVRQTPLGKYWSAWRKTARLPAGFHPSVAFGGDQDIFALLWKPGEYVVHIARARVTAGGELAPWQFVGETGQGVRLAVTGAGFAYLLENGLRVLVAPLGGERGIGTFVPTRPVPDHAWQGGAVIVRGRLFVLGGGGKELARREVVSAEIGPDGQLGPWRAETPLPMGLCDLSVAASGDRVYVARGTIQNRTMQQYWIPPRTADESPFMTNARVLSAGVGENGILGPWEEEEIPGLDVDAPVVVSGGLLVSSGGATGDSCVGTLYFENRTIVASIGPTGRLGPWLNSEPLPFGRAGHELVAVGGWIYVVGGARGEEGESEVRAIAAASLSPGWLSTRAALRPPTPRRR